MSFCFRVSGKSHNSQTNAPMCGMPFYTISVENFHTFHTQFPTFYTTTYFGTRAIMLDNQHFYATCEFLARTLRFIWAETTLLTTTKTNKL